MIESHRLPNGNVLTLQIGPEDLIQPPEGGFRRVTQGDGYALDVQQQAPVSAPIKQEDKQVTSFPEKGAKK